MKPYQRDELERRDAQASEYDEWLRSNKGDLFDQRERNVFADLLKPLGAATALDIGAGTGRLTEAAAPHVRELVSADLSVESLRFLQARVSGAHAICSDASVQPFKDGTFDVAISCQVFHLMRFEELVEAFREVHRILSPGGKFIVSVSNQPYWRYRGVLEYGEVDGSYTRPLSKGQVGYLADKAGLEIVYTGYYKSLPFRRLKSRGWLFVDRALGRTPFIREKLNALMVVVLRKGV